MRPPRTNVISMDDEELAKLMREIDQMGGSSGAQPPAAAAPSSEVEKTGTESSGGKGRWVAVATVASGVGGFVVGSVLWFVPWVDPASTGLGAALGGAIASAIGRPPRWLSR